MIYFHYRYISHQNRLCHYIPNQAGYRLTAIGTAVVIAYHKFSLCVCVCVCTRVSALYTPQCVPSGVKSRMSASADEKSILILKGKDDCCPSC